MRSPTNTKAVDYLVVGAGASSLAFVDALVSASPDVEVLIVDRRHAPGGHWVDAYPFVRLHQPSAYYGVNSLRLGHDRRAEHGPETGWYERASGAELVDYYARVLDQCLLPSGRVSFLANTDYIGSDAGNHVVESRLTGRRTNVTVRRRIVDATYIASEIPSASRRPFTSEPTTSVLTPTELVDAAAPPAGFTVLGAGKTAMDTCTWLLDAGVDPDDITWIRPRDAWLIDRRTTQPYELSGEMVEYQSRLIEALAGEATGHHLSRCLEDLQMFHRIDRSIEPEVLRGATINTHELEQLRSISNVVRLGRVRHVGDDAIVMERGDLPARRRSLYIDCTAQGLATSPTRSIFEHDRIVVQFTTLGVAPWSAAILGFVESLDLLDTERNRLCPPVPRTGLIHDYPIVLHAGFGAEGQRLADPSLQEWAGTARLNPGRSIASVMTEPKAQDAMARMMTHLEPALTNLERVNPVTEANQR